MSRQTRERGIELQGVEEECSGLVKGRSGAMRAE
jgi:hypothetical protein